MRTICPSGQPIFCPPKHLDVTDPTSTSPEVSNRPFDDAIVRRFLWATMVWFFVSGVVGAYAAILKIAPQIVADPTVAYGRMQPVHTNLAMFGLMANGIFALVYHSAQRLCGRDMFSWGLSRLHFWSWQIIVAAGMLQTPLGITSSRYLASWQWPIDVAMAVSWIGFFGVNFVLTIAKRRTAIAYISLWFYGASVLVVSVLHSTVSLMQPIGPWQSIPWIGGVADAMTTWFYAGNLTEFLVTAPLLGALYYYVPKLVDRPIANYPLAIVHFWSWTILTLWSWPRHLHYTPIPEWLSSLGMLVGIALLMPSLAGVVVLWQTLRSASRDKRRQPAARLAGASLVFYAAWIILSTLASTKFFDAWVHYTEWVSAMSHLWGIGFATLALTAMMYYLSPMVFQSAMPRPALATIHFYLCVVATGLFVVPSGIAAAVQSRYLLSLDRIGNLANPEYQKVLTLSWPLWFWAAAGGVLFVVGYGLMLVNLLRSWHRRPEQYASQYPARMDGDQTVVELQSESSSGDLQSAPVLELAHRFQTFGQLQWHHQYERLPRRIFVPIAAVIFAAMVVQWLPGLWIATGDAAMMSYADYTPLETIGRQIYRREGCVSCHSQTVRPLVAETKRYGLPSSRLDFANDRPVLWGHRRIGPDLARIGGVQTSLWHWQHLQNPRDVNELSIMPSFGHLTAQRIDLKAVNDGSDQQRSSVRSQAERIAADIVSQGGPLSTAGVLTIDSNATALIAYLQRLGVAVDPPAAVSEAEVVGEAEAVTATEAAEPTPDNT